MSVLALGVLVVSVLVAPSPPSSMPNYIIPLCSLTLGDGSHPVATPEGSPVEREGLMVDEGDANTQRAPKLIAFDLDGTSFSCFLFSYYLRICVCLFTIFTIFHNAIIPTCLHRLQLSDIHSIAPLPYLDTLWHPEMWLCSGAPFTLSSDGTVTLTSYYIPTLNL
jgi:hypothetical protein